MRSFNQTTGATMHLPVRDTTGSKLFMGGGECLYLYVIVIVWRGTNEPSAPTAPPDTICFQ